MLELLTLIGKNAKRLLLISGAVLLVGLAAGLIGLRKEVTLIVNGAAEEHVTYALTVQNFLETQGFDLLEEDHVTPDRKQWLKKGDTVRLDQASRYMTRADGTVQVLLTGYRRPVDIFEEADIPLASRDRVYVDGREVDPQEEIPYHPEHSIQVKRASRITLEMGGEQHLILSGANTLGEALAEEEIPLQHGDRLRPSLETVLDGTPLQVQLTFAQEVVIDLPDRTIRTLAAASTVGEALARLGLGLQGQDYTEPEDTAPLPEDGQVRVVRVEEEIILEQEPIPYGRDFQAAPEVELDSQAVLEPGAYGIKAQRVRVRYENGEEVSRKNEKEWVVKEPQDRVVGYGTKITLRTVDTNEGPRQYWRKITAYATSYKPGDPGVNTVTASGATLKKGVIAVVRSWYNYMQGQQVYIPGYGVATIEDIGGGIPGSYWVDLGYASQEEYVSWHQNVTVYFLAPVPPANQIMWVLE
jgi:uncharacterized protein YabE (DUF348 family)